MEMFAKTPLTWHIIYPYVICVTPCDLRTTTDLPAGELNVTLEEARTITRGCLCATHTDRCLHVPLTQLE